MSGVRVEVFKTNTGFAFHVLIFSEAIKNNKLH
jgi:hypothetical protein